MDQHLDHPESASPATGLTNGATLNNNGVQDKKLVQNVVDNIIGEQLNNLHDIVKSSKRNVNAETTIESLVESGSPMINGEEKTEAEDKDKNAGTKAATVQRKIGLANQPSFVIETCSDNKVDKKTRFSVPNNVQQSGLVVQQRRTSAPVATRYAKVDKVALQSSVSDKSGTGCQIGEGFVTVHVLLDRNKLEKVLFSPNQEQKTIIDVLRTAAGASSSDIIKLYDQSGRCVQVTPDLKSELQYRLQVSKYPLAPSSATPVINSELLQELDLVLHKIRSLERCLFPLRSGLLRSPKNVATSPNSSQERATANCDSRTDRRSCDIKEQTDLSPQSSTNLCDTSISSDNQISFKLGGNDDQSLIVSKDQQDQLIQQLEMLSTRIQVLTTRANEIGAEWIGCGVGVHCAGAFREQFSRRRISLPKHAEVKAKFTMICDTATTTFSSETLQLLRLPAFDSYAWSDEQLLLLLHGMFTELELTSAFRIRDSVLRQFLYEVYKHYNEVPFHNFRHCFCVSQMMYSMAWKVDLVSRLGHLEVLVLLISCICHDLDHPGYNNIYQINARTELAIRYNDISPLENHHCSVAFRILELPECNILEGLSSETYRHVREGIIRCILATDMARHNEILAQFRDVIPSFDYDNRTHTNLLSMVLIKVADISNEARPLDVAEPWLDRLLQEFFAQSAAEKQEGLPVTPFMDPDKVSKPSSQVRFIGLVLLPLFEALGEHMPELQDLIVQPVRYALDHYRRLNEATREGRSRKSLGDALEPLQNLNSPTGSQSISGSQSNHSVRSRRSLVPRMSLSISRSVDDNQTQTMDNKSITPETSHDTPSAQDIERFILKNRKSDDDVDGDEKEALINDESEEENDSGDSETATEVEVSEKTLKFKIATEGGGSSNDRRNSRIGIPSRKNSHERCTLSHAFGNASYSLDLQKYDYRRGSLGPSSSGGSLGNFCSNCQMLENTNRCCRAGRNSEGSVRSPCSDSCQRSAGSAGSHSVRQISEEFEPEPEPVAKPSIIKTETTIIEETEKTEPKQNLDEITVDNKNLQTTITTTTTQQANRSLFARLKNFTDRLTLSFDKQYAKNNNMGTTNDDVFTRASTLPKSKRVEAKKTWKILMYNKDKTTTNSVDVLTDVLDGDKDKDKVEI